MYIKLYILLPLFFIYQVSYTKLTGSRNEDVGARNVETLLLQMTVVWQI